MDIKKVAQNTVASVLIAGGSFNAADQMNKDAIDKITEKAIELQQVIDWKADQVEVFEQQQAVIRRQKQILEKWDSCDLCKERCSPSR